VVSGLRVLTHPEAALLILRSGAQLAHELLDAVLDDEAVEDVNGNSILTHRGS